MMRALILCAGGARRWPRSGPPAYLDGIPKQLIPIAGERLVDRTVRQLRNRGVTDIRVVVRPEFMDDPQWRVPGARRERARLDASREPADKYLSSRHLWSKTASTLVLFGDVWHHDDVMDGMVKEAALWSAVSWWSWFRFGPGGDGGELFAFVWRPDQLDRVEAALQRVVDEKPEGVPGGWALYRALAGADLTAHADHGSGSLVTDGWTDDFDTAIDYRRWCAKWARTAEHERPS